jgi:aryl-alcohol dehydrogenase-like predicted oxidoreductase
MHRWTLDEDAAAPLFQQAVELGVTFWDTANVYQGGTSEEFVGRAIRRFTRGEDIVLATKVHDSPEVARARPYGQKFSHHGARSEAAATGTSLRSSTYPLVLHSSVMCPRLEIDLCSLTSFVDRVSCRHSAIDLDLRS